MANEKRVFIQKVKNGEIQPNNMRNSNKSPTKNPTSNLSQNKDERDPLNVKEVQPLKTEKSNRLVSSPNKLLASEKNIEGTSQT